MLDEPRAAQDGTEVEEFPYPLDLSDIIGTRTGELHRALAAPTDDPAFGTEPVTESDVSDWIADTLAQADDAFRRLAAADKTQEVDRLLSRRQEAESLIRGFGDLVPSGGKSRIHGDYHLGQILIGQADIYIIDFEGEPRRTLDERRARSSPLRDIAGMLRSFDYAAFAALDRVRAKHGLSEMAEAAAKAWRDRSIARFRAAYADATDGLPTIPEDDNLLRLFMFQKAFYEIGYEATNRPAWLSVPIRGVLSLLDESEC
jgi:maltose alpha-D-glucosyltransferase/alpha-amylase